MCIQVKCEVEVGVEIELAASLDLYLNVTGMIITGLVEREDVQVADRNCIC